MEGKAVAAVVTAYFTIAFIVLLSGYVFPKESEAPIFVSFLLLVPLYLWKKNYAAELSKEVDGRDKDTILSWALALFILAMLVRIPSVLLFNMPYEKLPLIYLLILTIVITEKTDVSAFGFKTQNMERAILHGTLFYLVSGGTYLFTIYSLVYVFTNQIPVLSYNIIPFLSLMPFHTLLVGISEEGLFRGYIQTHLQKFHSHGAIIIQAFLFGIWHFVWNLSPFDPVGMFQYVAFTFLIGLIFGYFYSKAKNLVPLIFAHGLWNSFPSGIVKNEAALNLFRQAPFLTQFLVFSLSYVIASIVAFFFVKYWVKEI